MCLVRKVGLTIAACNLLSPRSTESCQDLRQLTIPLYRPLALLPELVSNRRE